MTGRISLFTHTAAYTGHQRAVAHDRLRYPAVLHRPSYARNMHCACMK